MIYESLEKLRKYCEAEEFKGYDPYDGLNSKLFQSLPLIPKSRFIRLIWIQFFKRSPVNLRSLVGIEKDYNPKALGILLSAYCVRYRMTKDPDDQKKINYFIEKIIDFITPGYSGACWGYNFDWESRAFFQPKFTPTIVASSFIACALLDAYDITGDDKLIKLARSTCDFILKDLNRNYDENGNFAFSYSRLDKSIVYNASLLGSRLLSRVYSITKEDELLENARKSVNYCCDKQKSGGEWSYGAYSFHQWIDNFHTGYNLECIFDYMKFSGDHSFQENLDRGFEYYIKTFFTNEGIPKYYSNSVYPIDIHSPAQLIITLVKLGRMDKYEDLAGKVLRWTISRMQNQEKGFFYFQINKYFISRISYMRWSQSWMLYALSMYKNYFISLNKK